EARAASGVSASREFGSDCEPWADGSRSIARWTEVPHSRSRFLWRATMPIDVLLADDHQIVRQGLKSLLERHGFRVLGGASDGREAVALAATCQPDVAVLDLAMPSLNGVDAAREMQSTAPRLKTILLTMHTEEPYVLEALRAGVAGYVLKAQAA